MQTKIINLYGAPSTGKSTAACAIFAELKKLGFSVELVPEFAKELVWNERWKDLRDQFYVTGVQNNRLRNLVGSVDYVITDSPILLGAIYSKRNDYHFDEFERFLIKTYQTYNNLDFVIKKELGYETSGRQIKEAESFEIQQEIEELIKSVNPDAVFCGRVNIVETVVDFIKTRHQLYPSSPPS